MTFFNLTFSFIFTFTFQIWLRFRAVRTEIPAQQQALYDIRKELFCDIFQMMPDHLHAIVRIEPVPIEGMHDPVPDVGAQGRARLHQVQGEPLKFGVAYRSPKSISSFMVGFKSAATKKINDLRQTPGQPVWQPRFNDRIIRDEEEFQQKFKYIQKNSENWQEGEREE